MKGDFRFSPTTGEELSQERHKPGQIPFRESLAGDGELTNGVLTSSPKALLEYFQRCHQRMHEADDALYRAMALGVRQLKSKTDAWDVWVWYALAEYLTRKGYDVAWMLAFTEPRCPRCGSRIKFEPSEVGFAKAGCASHCGKDSNDRTIEIRDRIEEVYETAFEPIDRFEAF